MDSSNNMINDKNNNQHMDSKDFNSELFRLQSSVRPNSAIEEEIDDIDYNADNLDNKVNLNSIVEISNSKIDNENTINNNDNQNLIFDDNSNDIFSNENDGNVFLDNSNNVSKIDINFFEESNLESEIEQVLFDEDAVSDKEVVNEFDSNIIVSDLNKEIFPKEIVVNKINEDYRELNKDDVVVFKNRKEIVFDDWIDTEDIGDVFSIKRLLESKKFLMVLSILIFIFVSIIVIKVFYLRNKVDSYEEFFTVIESKNESSVVVSNNGNDDEIFRNDAATELINCINSSIDMDKMPNSISSIIDEINNYYNQSNNYFSFVYKDLFTGFMVSYNANQSIFAASSIKAPKDIYLWEMASKGLVNLDEELTYTSGYYNNGSGVLKNKKIDTNYSVRTLLGYSTIDSDNAAHNMLMDKYGRENMYNFWKEKGTKSIFTANNNWGVTSGNDAAIYMEELYKFYVNDTEYGKDAMNNFINSYPKFLKGKNDYKVASKSGWSGSSLHDISIIFADNPYILVALSNLGDTDYYMSYFNTVNDLGYRLHTEYWKYKMSICGNISQYE